MSDKIIVEKSRVKESFIWAMTLIILTILGSSCSEEQQFSGNSQVETTFQLESTSALGGSITIQQAYLKLDHIAISGALRGKNVPGASHPVPAEEPPFVLAGRDSSHVKFTVTSRTYDIMDLHLVLFADDYQPVFNGQPVVEIPNPPQNNGDDGTDEEENEDDDAEDGEDNSVDEGNTGSDEDEDEGSGEDDGDDEDDQDANDDSGDEGDDNDDSEEEEEEDDDSSNGRQDGEDAGESDNGNKKNDKDSDAEDKNDKKSNKAKGENKDNKRNGGRTGSQTVDIDHFFQNAKPGIAIFGTWDYNGQKTNIVFVVTDPERITVRAIQNNSYRIVLEEQNTSVVSFDPEKWFAGVSVNDLQSASVQMYQGQPVLFIHKQVNSELFHKLYSGLTQSAEFRIGPQISE